MRNRFDGRVEAVFEGTPDDVDALVEWCRRGPSGARVDSFEVIVEAPAGDSAFRILG